MKADKRAGRLFFSRTAEFLGNYLVNQTAKSPYTVKSYRDALTVFRRYVYNEKGFSVAKFSFQDCTREFLLDFIVFLKEKGISPGTCNQRLTAIKSYLWYCADFDITLQPSALTASHIPFQREPKLNRETLSEDALAAIFTAPKANRIGKRDQMIMILLYDTAVRLSELTGMLLSDANLAVAEPYVRVRGKGNKDRVVALSDKATEHLRHYIHAFHSNTSCGNTPLFYTVIKDACHRISHGNIERIINKYADSIRGEFPGLPDKVYPHMFRRTRATNLYQSGVALELVSRILGHSSTETTKIYAAPSIEMLKRAMESVDGFMPDESPIWEGDEDAMARMCGLR
ncbi:MAG: site-specific integrase [Clostridiales bacterium]|nr:site-specific integrase [Clostridiales bacterium]